MANPEASETGKARDVAGSPRSRSSFVERAVRYFGLCGPAEFYAASSISVLMVALEFANLFRFRFDSDESQHLHVIWSWMRGLVQYRDIFDKNRIVSAEGTATGMLDGAAMDAARFLAPGKHVFVPALPGRALAAIWAQAVDRGFNPFSTEQNAN